MAACSDLNANSFMDISIGCLNKKRKFQSELLEMNLQRHVCCEQVPAYDSSDLCTKKAKSSMYVRGDESYPNSSEDSCIFNGDTFTCFPDGNKMRVLYQKSSASIRSSTTSIVCDGTSSEISPYSLESRSVTKSCSNKSASLSACEEVDCHGLLPCPMYEEHILEFGSYANCNCMNCLNDGLEHCTDKERYDLLYLDGVAPSNYVLSSGRWPVDQGTICFHHLTFSLCLPPLSYMCLHILFLYFLMQILSRMPRN